jgi:arginine decarboxylase
MALPPLLSALGRVADRGQHRFHMPGHAGRDVLGLSALLGPDWALRHDQSEVDGLDVLSEPTDTLKASQAWVAACVGVAQSFYLVNGATAGLQTALLASLRPGDRVLLPRNVHRAVISALVLTGAEPVWFLPDWDANWGLWLPLPPVDALLAQHRPRALVVTSPTYEGLGSNIPELLHSCRQHDCLLIVDEAHGGLWPFSHRLPESACNQGADAVIQSLHKTAGSLTQSAVLHLPFGSRLEPVAVQQALNAVQTTSPSYLLLASLEAAVHTLTTQPQLLNGLLDQVAALRHVLSQQLTGIQLYPTPSDPTKLYLHAPGCAGTVWGERVEAQGRIACEAITEAGVLYLAGLGLQGSDFAALQHALLAEDAQLTGPPPVPALPVGLPVQAMTPRDAFFAPGQTVPADLAVGRVAKETVVHCPPGIPVVVPGEVIQPEHRPLLPDTLWVVC